MAISNERFRGRTNIRSNSNNASSSWRGNNNNSKPTTVVAVVQEKEQTEEDEKPRTLFVGNVPREVHKREIEEIFGDVGPLKRCYIQYPRDGNEKRKQREDTTVAYVTFALSQDATTALETLQNTKIGDNRINIKFAKARSEQERERPSLESRGGGFQSRRNPNLEPLGGEAAVPKAKEPRPKAIKKKSRLIVRNLSFKVTDENMKEWFGKFGDVKDINILKKPNGKLVGCAFVQYQNIFQAAKAIKELNMKPFLGRPVAIDWALPKEKYQTKEEKERKQDGGEWEDDPAKSNDTIEIKDEAESETEEKPEGGNLSDHLEHLKEESNSDSDSEEDSEDEDSASEEDEKPPKGPRKHPPKERTNDVEEGMTLFLRNLSFQTSEDNLKEFFEKFGDLHYALLCKDSLTEHPKGTAFIKFKIKSAADKCLTEFNVDPTTFTLSGRQFNVSLAISKDKLGSNNNNFNKNSSDQRQGQQNQEKKNSSDAKPKSDSRNLYLAREGFIRPGSAAAAEISAADKNKRAALNKTKKQMMKNLNIIISPTRLCIHNLPQTYTDKQLRTLFKEHGGPGGKINEARIMRDMKDLDLNAKGKSKGYGFVNFTQHEHALKALRSLNNNPSVFKASSRPIVEFSMENRLALQAKEKRALKSKEKNPNLNKQIDAAAENENDDEEEEEESINKKQKGKRNKKKNKTAQSAETPTPKDGGGDEDADADIPKYAGLKFKKGVQGLPAMKPKGKISRNSLKPKRSKKKNNLPERRKREAKAPSKRPLEKIDKTERIIKQYKRKMDSAGGEEGRKKKKWFE